MAGLQRSYPFQSRRAYGARLAKYAAICRLSTPRAYAAVVQACRVAGVDYDWLLASAAHSFAGRDFFAQLRRQPCDPLRQLLQRRIATFPRRGTQRLHERAERGARFARNLPNGMVLGSQNANHTYWVLPVRVGNPLEVLAELRRSGFDATARSSLSVVPFCDRTPGRENECAPWLAETIFLPNGCAMPEREWQRMTTVVRNVAQLVPSRRSGEPIGNRGPMLPV
jgi:hypothetical protein